jgi:bifunctional ADP-heptose synthase (sugar kinase/adenylyltransferase)
VGAKEVINNGGKVKIIKLYKKFSTTSLINKSRNK